jgi:cytochrome c biogenesis protein CcmG, thiol:disulfide interchange protein DsbE
MLSEAKNLHLMRRSRPTLVTDRGPPRRASMVLGLCAVLLFSGCAADSFAGQPGDAVPAFSAVTTQGEHVSLASLRGEVVLLNVWATWCYPCRKEMPSFESLHQDLGADGLRVVAVSIDGAGSASEVSEFLAEYGISFTVLHDPAQDVTRAFRTRGVPETFLIDRDGRLVKRWIGRIDGHSEAVRAPIRAALADS